LPQVSSTGGWRLRISDPPKAADTSVVVSSGDAAADRPVELAGLPQFLCPSRNRFAVTHRDHHFRGGPLHDLMHNERRQVIEQMHIIHTHHCGAGGGGSQRLDHPADQLNDVGASRLRPGVESTQRKCPRRG
jgi:hypothetical protein